LQKTCQAVLGRKGLVFGVGLDLPSGKRLQKTMERLKDPPFYSWVNQL
jgi:hypothetical protein